ncbi:nuclear transport factor 2 family protein [Alteromonas portus]|uniref:Nuclear transport factor 2 family protein n=1 Tax=Alteromonas portus TaxID=2565549 RepID=A0A4U0ZEF2_9ALTE|nr:nuclear transport factor 2 family protein [Alteromonas portus]TKB02987.1 nuclear transport factor 2 family protein [Alteromonas portus]
MDVITHFCKIYTDICQISPVDLEGVYADDILFIDPITTHRGIEEVKNYFANLLTQAESCKFDIADIFTCSKQISSRHSNVTHVVNWTMTLVLKDNAKKITLDGSTQLSVRNNFIIYHKDYYDLGEMVYEHVPILGFIIKKIKGKLAK